VAALTRGLWLLRSAVGYALTATGSASSARLAAPTPCAGWDLGILLAHVADSMGVLSEAIAAGSAAPGPLPGGGRPGGDPSGGDPSGGGPSGGGPSGGDTSGGDPLVTLRCRAAGLLAACAGAGPDERLVVIGDRWLPASMTAVAGALEITVHGWDIAASCGTPRPVPPGLAAVLLPVAPLLITPPTRRGLFADPVCVPGRPVPGDQLVAFLGRQPRPPGTPGPA
jgi:uncharacterized protein (TIGR03083 family)